MKIEKISEPIAVRKLLAGSNFITVTMGKPISVKEEDYYCPYSIEYLKKTDFNYAYGVDQFQAIILTIKKISIDLSHLEVKDNEKIIWLDHEPGFLGFD